MVIRETNTFILSTGCSSSGAVPGNERWYGSPGRDGVELFM